MKLRHILQFLFQAVTVGLAAFIVVVFLKPELINYKTIAEATRSVSTASRELPVRIPAAGPVSYANAVKRTATSVVNIYSAKVIKQRRSPLLDDPFFQRFLDKPSPGPQVETSLGSGVIMTSDGYILTNNHVIEGADEILVGLANGDTARAVIVGSDPDTDLAVLRINYTKLPAITLASSEPLQVGDVVLAIGNPFGVGQTVTMGIVSATGRNQLGINTFENFIQTDAAINPGNSGGALINARGELVGINTAIFSRSGGSQGIGFAIPASLALTVMQQITNNGRVIRGWLGVEAQDVSPELAAAFDLEVGQGVLISGVLRGGPADLAGIRPGDLITNINGTRIHDTLGLLNTIAANQPGHELEIKALRNGKELSLMAKVAERPGKRI